MILPIDIERVPYQFDVELDRTLFTFEIHYNSKHDFFTVDLIRNGEVIAYGEKIIYGVPLFRTYTDDRLPTVTITPRDTSGNETRVSIDNLGSKVFLEVDES